MFEFAKRSFCWCYCSWNGQQYSHHDSLPGYNVNVSDGQQPEFRSLSEEEKG